MRAPRRLRADCSPSTQLSASLRFDLPHPLGPTTAAMPPPLNRNSVRSQNDLKPWSSTFLSFSKQHLNSHDNVVKRHHTNRDSDQSKVPSIPHNVFSSRLPQYLVPYLASLPSSDGHDGCRFSRNAREPSLKS